MHLKEWKENSVIVWTRLSISCLCLSFTFFLLKRQIADNSPYSQSHVLSSGHVQMWQLDHKEGWKPKNWWFWTVVLKKTFESPLNWKEMKSVNPKGNQPWIFIGRTDAEAETPILRPPDAKSWLIRKDPDTRKDWRQKKGAAEEEMVSQHHRLNGHESEQTLEDSGAWHAACSPWGLKESDAT